MDRMERLRAPCRECGSSVNPVDKYAMIGRDKQGVPNLTDSKH